MAITLRHQLTGVGGLAGYAAGRGRARERKSKYGLDILRDQQQMRFRQGLENQRQQFAVGLEGFRASQDALRDERRHEFRIEETEKADELSRKREEERRKYEEGLASREEARRTARTLPKVPSWVAPETRRFLMEQAQAIRELAENFDITEPEAGAKFAELVFEYNEVLDSERPLDVAEEENAYLAYRDPSGVVYNEPGPGRRAYDTRTREYVDATEGDPRESQMEQMKQFNTWDKTLHDMAARQAEAEHGEETTPAHIQAKRAELEKQFRNPYQMPPAQAAPAATAPVSTSTAVMEPVAPAATATAPAVPAEAPNPVVDALDNVLAETQASSGFGTHSGVQDFGGGEQKQTSLDRRRAEHSERMKKVHEGGYSNAQFRHAQANMSQLARMYNADSVDDITNPEHRKLFEEAKRILDLYRGT